MSLPFYKITCSGCEFHGGYGLGIIYTFDGPPEREPLLAPAWCKKCDAIVRASVSFTRSDAGDLKQISDWEEFIIHAEVCTEKRKWWGRKKEKEREKEKIEKAVQELLALKKTASGTF